MRSFLDKKRVNGQRLPRVLGKYRTFLSYSFFKKIDVFHNRVTDYLVFFFSSIYLKRYIFGHLPDSLKGAMFGRLVYLYSKFRRFNKRNNGGDLNRLISFILNIEYVVGEKKVQGDFAEVGVWRGNTAQVLSYYSKIYGRKCYLFDTFEGFHSNDLKDFDSQFNCKQYSDTSFKMVKEVMGEDYFINCEVVSGYFPESIPSSLKNRKFSVVSLDADLYAPTKAGLENFFPLMSNGGLFLLHDYSSGYWAGCKRAIDEFCEKEKQLLVLMPDKSGSAFIRVQKP